MDGPRTLLFVIGMPVIREPLAAAVRGAEFEVISTDSTAAALRTLREQHIDLVVIDLDLPGGAGWQLMTCIREGTLASLPVVALSSAADKAAVVQAAKHRVGAFILKARFSLQFFVERVRQLLTEQARGAGTPAHEERAPAPGAAERPRPAVARPVVVEKRGVELDAGALLKSIKPIMTRTEMNDCIDRCEQLKAFSPTVAQLMKITATEDCSIQRVVRAVGQDHAIALKIMKLANSVAYGRGEPVDTVKSAVMGIGLEKIRQAVMNIGLIEHFDAGIGAVSLPHFWEHAIGCGIVAGELAHSTGVDAEAAFTAGLLHDVGRLVLAEQLGERYARVLTDARELRLPLEHVESRMLLVNHADVMDRLLHGWKFSKHLKNPVVFHHLSAGGIRQACPREVAPVATLALANRLTHAMLLGSSGNEVVYPTEELCQTLRIDGATIAAVCESGPSQAADMKVSLLSNGVTGNWKSYRDEVIAAVRVPAHILFESSEPAIDAFRILCRTVSGLGGSDGLEPPNVGVVHIPHGRDIVKVSTRYRTAEEQAGCGPLPLMVISPLGQLNVEQGLAAGRCVVRVASPVNVHTFVERLNSLIAGTACDPLARLAA